MHDSDKYLKTFTVSWERLHKDSSALGFKLKSQMHFNGIVAVSRGGLIPAAIVSRILNVRLIDTVCVASYEDKKQAGRVEIVKSLDIKSDGWLIIDDLSDTGRTAEIVCNMIPGAHFAALYAKPMGKAIVQTYVKEVSQDTWIVFPWENKAKYETGI